MPSSDAVSVITAKTTVAELLRCCPRATGVFLRRRMHCPGCHMSAFMTLGEAAASYGVAAEDLVTELRGVVAAETSIIDPDQTSRLSRL